MVRQSASLPHADSCRRTSSKAAFRSSPSSPTYPARLCRRLPLAPVCAVSALDEDLVDQSVAYCILRRHEVVAVRVLGNPLDALSGALRKDLVQPFAQVQDFLGVDLDVGSLALHAAER